jgi:diaminohydroxyphosphoribosylaminopyrimidine deaminase/5-amino-6-(5-phosphoribosylamino)uracil reductase
MAIHPGDETQMWRALDLAQATVGLASPNPQVGCVLVRDGEIVGQGAHLYDQFDHAEIVALKQAGARTRGATAYVTLEPCSHHGRTGPCADALIAAGVRRVVVAMVDPNPRVSGQGIARLRAAGIEVAVGLLQHEARRLNDAFAKFIRTGRPLVTLKAALSADGKLAPPNSARTGRQPHWLTGPQSRAEVQRVVLDSQLRTPLDSQLVRSAHDDLLLLCAAEASPARAAALRAVGVEVECIAGQSGRQSDRLDLGAVLDLLGEGQILSLLLECGSELNGAFLTQNLVDKVVLFHSDSDVTLGEHAIPFAAAFGPPSTLEPSLSSVSRKAFGPDTCVSGVLRDPWDGLGDELG